MKGKSIREFLKKKKAVGCAALAAVLIIGGVAVWQPAQEPEFPSYTDPVMEEVSIQEDETPLASSPKVTTKTTKKKSTKTVKLKKASTKTYTKKLPTTTNKKSSTKTSGNQTITTETTVVTATTEKYTKKKKTKKVTKVVTTTVKTTTVTESTQVADGGSDAESVDNESISGTTQTASTTQKYEVDVATIAPKMNSQVLSAYKTLGFKVYVDPSVTSYSGYFDAKAQSITLRSEDSTIYHELGHFLAFIANNYDRSSAFSSVYSSEKGLYTGVNKVYVTQSASEYFAESVRDYVNDPSSLKTNRPLTYAAVETALNSITDTQIARIQKIYGAFWN